MDPKGSLRFASTPSRTMFYDAGIAPYGEHYAETGSTKGIFAGMIQNTVVGMYDTPNREYDTASGRWLSPDPAGLAAVDLTNPQSLNRYAYVMNNPTTLIDPSGLCTPGTPNCPPPGQHFSCNSPSCNLFGGGRAGADLCFQVCVSKPPFAPRPCVSPSRSVSRTEPSLK
jgi:RHS repeat-associated protein